MRKLAALGSSAATATVSRDGRFQSSSNAGGSQGRSTAGGGAELGGVGFPFWRDDWRSSVREPPARPLHRLVSCSSDSPSL